MVLQASGTVSAISNITVPTIVVNVSGKPTTFLEGMFICLETALPERTGHLEQAAVTLPEEKKEEDSVVADTFEAEH